MKRIGIVLALAVLIGSTASAREQDLTTLLSKFLTDLYSGSIGGSTLWSSLTLTKSAIAVTPSDALTITNTTASTVGTTVQMSGRARWRGTAWDTDDAVSRTYDWSADVLPVTGNVISGGFRLGYSLGGAAYTYPFVLTSSTLTLDDAVAFKWSDVSLARGAADRLELATGDSFKIVSGGLGVGVTNATAGTIQASASQITAGAGTGITVNNAGDFRDAIYKVTIDRTAFVTAGVTSDVTVATLPAKTQIIGVMADVTQVFACASVCTTSTLSMVFGRGSGGAQWLASFDADAATAQFGDADAELGTTMTRAAAIQGGSFESWSSTQAAVLRLTSGTGNIGTGAATNLSTGSVTLYIHTRIFP